MRAHSLLSPHRPRPRPAAGHGHGGGVLSDAFQRRIRARVIAPGCACACQPNTTGFVERFSGTVLDAFVACKERRVLMRR